MNDEQNRTLMIRKLTILLLLLLIFHDRLLAVSDTVVTCRDTTVCLYQSDFQIVVCSPYGGHYFGPGVKDTVENTYVPFWAGLGKHLVTYRIGSYSCQFHVTIIDRADAGAITGENRVCRDDMFQTYLVPPDSTAENYHWEIPQWKGFTQITTAPQITIHFDSTFYGGTLSAVVHNQCGDGEPSLLQLEVMPKPLPTIRNLMDTLSTSDEVCVKQRLTYYTGGTFDSCKWVVTGGHLLSSDTSRLVRVNWTDTGGTGKLEVIAYLQGCSGRTSRNILIGEEVAPEPPSIWLFGYNMLVCSDSTASSYCWFQDGQVYTGIVSPSGRYILPDPGNKQSVYTVRTSSNSNCSECYNDSAPFTLTATGIGTLQNRCLIASPNPVKDILYLRADAVKELSGRIFIYNQMGIIVMNRAISGERPAVETEQLKPGVYMVEFKNFRGERFYARIIKL